MKKIFALFTVLFVLCSCSNKAKRNFGITESLPDEYQVTRNKPLEVPPFYDGESKKK